MIRRPPRSTLFPYTGVTSITLLVAAVCLLYGVTLTRRRSPNVAGVLAITAVSLILGVVLGNVWGAR